MKQLKPTIETPQEEAERIRQEDEEHSEEADRDQRLHFEDTRGVRAMLKREGMICNGDKLVI